MESSGARLKKIRLEKGLTLEDVQKKTKVHLDILKAIEEDTLVNLNPIYLKGFLKIYCNFLGVDPKDYSPDYKKSQSSFDRTAVPEAVLAKAAPIKPQALKLGSFKGLNIKKVVVFLAVGVAIIFLLAVLWNLGKFIALRRHGTSVARPKITASVSPKSIKPLSSKILKLGISAKEDCFIQLKVDGRMVFYRTLKKGRFESWNALEKIEFSLSNAGAAALQVNGQPIPPVGRKGQAVKNIILTRDGLSIPR